ncbi:Co2+/Mg2+ efflux protein ApaG [Cognaticolwellia beringensis]|uniref:Protein ApaG n=1 Tax=Cognaticolwellia beringensis TaxID=1967665 RepID=A0A222G425_9GAMM|nr:Co2+/Mg2+ efflux protein ApaG [Cognaticolwellia beringensis]ASP46540.1 Co2+/Mg2+ efflux protein ApaG [Cognaticolwellia beringensis]|tara:strand:- start:690 stop:1082 length:393 start_codon:yes stop_codon:yes gene_type:complete
MSNDKVASVADIQVSVVTDYIAQQSIEAEQQFVFSYTITVTNNSAETVQLLSRYWLITDANGDSSTVTGEGVIGQQPFIKTDQSFTYSSGCVLKSPLGNMQGHYQMRTDSAELIQVDIPVFRLAKPNILN